MMRLESVTVPYAGFFVRRCLSSDKLTSNNNGQSQAYENVRTKTKPNSLSGLQVSTQDRQQHGVMALLQKLPTVSSYHGHE